MNKSADYFLKSLVSQVSQPNLDFYHHNRNRSYNRNHNYSHSDRRGSRSGYDNNSSGGNHRR
ncbi:hypothetical protein [Lacihabitans sp. CS3-21]|uniref:hypothetical protein n=1 Tax=Lacihabitans sp. CS3-21 TaxID=2487332 RepID=UPI0020CD8A71|nr:hypothetical protein [Lacihabitans sp. CS3-21]